MFERETHTYGLIILKIGNEIDNKMRSDQGISKNLTSTLETIKNCTIIDTTWIN